MSEQFNEKTRIVILGAGFGGVYALKRLHKQFHKNKNVHITIVNSRNYFLFTPLLHEVATGSLWPENIVEPLRNMFSCCSVEVVTGDVLGVSLDRKTVKTTLKEVPYDYLICGLGAKTNFRNTPGASDHAYVLKTLEDAVDLKNHFIDLFEEASHTPDEAKQKELLTFYVVGGGPTGVELAAEMSEFFYETFAQFYGKELMRHVRIVLLQKENVLLNYFPASLQKKSVTTLRKKHIDVRFGVGVVRVGSNNIETNEGTFAIRTVIWSAGVQPFSLSFDKEIKKDPAGRLVVNSNLQLVDNPFVYAIGDMASFTQEENKMPLPMLAQVAVKQGEYVGEHITRTLNRKESKKFFYKHKGDLVSLGEWAAIGEISGVRIWGHLAWWLWRTTYLFKLISWPKKFQVALDWTIGIFTPRDISEFYRKKP
jgi:NADH dehydrogenase